MNKFVKEELSKVKVAQLPEYDDTTVSMIIPKHSGVDGDDLKQDRCYLLCIEPYILNPPEGFTLHDNWNNGVAPKHQYMKAEVNVLMGKMVKVTSVGYDYQNNMDTNDVWEGWLPRSAVKIVREL